jgi:hypothetical protein
MKVRCIGIARLLQNRMLWLCVLGVSLAVSLAMRWTERGVQAQTATPPAAAATQPSMTAETLAATEQKAAVQQESKTTLAEDSANLLKLANSLQSDVNKTTKDMLSVSVVREAGQIEQLAHKMRTR